MKLSVIIPVYNEINTIEEILSRVVKVNLPKEVILIDDFSTDGTIEKYLPFLFGISLLAIAEKPEQTQRFTLENPISVTVRNKEAQ